MHIVYLIEFDREELPNKYIGSKTNCYFKDGIIYSMNDKPYWGSSTDAEYNQLIADESVTKTVTILSVCETVWEVLQKERDIHLENDVIGSCEYFNKVIATVNPFSHPDYATYRHSVTGKYKRLPRNHEKVLSGEWVGVTKDIPLNETAREKLRKWYENNPNPFLGKSHSEESRKRISDGVNNWLKSMTEEERKEHRELLSKTAKKTFAGRKQSDEEKENRAKKRRGKIIIVNLETGDRKLIKREDYKNYDQSVWITQSKFQFQNKNRYVNINTLEEKYFEKCSPDLTDEWVISSEYYKDRIVGERICVECGISFEHTRHTSRSTCSKECSSKLRSKVNKEKNKGRKKYINLETGETKFFIEEPDLTVWQWTSDPNRIIATKSCIICNEKFSITKREKYLRETCNPECGAKLVSKRLTGRNKVEN